MSFTLLSETIASKLDQPSLEEDLVTFNQDVNPCLATKATELFSCELHLGLDSVALKVGEAQSVHHSISIPE